MEIEVSGVLSQAQGKGLRGPPPAPHPVLNINNANNSQHQSLWPQPTGPEDRLLTHSRHYVGDGGGVGRTGTLCDAPPISLLPAGSSATHPKPSRLGDSSPSS